MEHLRDNPVARQRIRHLMKRINRLNKLHRQKMHPEEEKKQRTSNSPQKINRTNLMEGLRLGKSYALQLELLRKKANTRQERQLSPKERERLRQRSRNLERQNSRGSRERS